MPQNNKSRLAALLQILAMPLACALWWVCVDSLPFWRQALRAIQGSGSATGPELLPEAWLVLMLAYAGALLLAQALLGGRLLRWVLIALSMIGAGGFAFSLLYNAVMSPDMLRNALATDAQEALGLMSPALAGCFLAAAVPVTAFLWRFPAGRVRGLKLRAASAGAALLCLAASAAALFAFSQDLAFYMRGHRDARYFLSPVNVVYSVIRTQVHDKSPDSVKERIVVDAAPRLAPAPDGRPLIAVIVTGETARAANWGLDGYERDTTPQLRQADVINFSEATSCGTSTDQSVPCMYSRIGRRNYSRDRILAEEPVGALLARAGVRVRWVENQGGCKGACTGIETVNASDRLTPQERGSLCASGLCLDEALLPFVKPEEAPARPGTVSVIFLHMSGSHGPAYAKRYPSSFEHWGPVCRNANLSNCDPKELRNAYDNSILYTDHVLSTLIAELKARKDADTVLLYASDHGESLGENGFFLHGAPWSIAPKDQTRIPMVLWMSEGFKARQGVDEACLRERGKRPASHDNFWSTILGLAGVKSSAYEKADDLLGACRKPAL